MRILNTVYKFNTLFDDDIVDKKEVSFRKIESREEIEHRKRNINFKIRNIENEEIVKNEVVKGKSESGCNYKICSSSNIINNKIFFNNNLSSKLQKNIENSIKNKVVVNFKDLIELYKNEEIVKSCLQKLTFYFQGRYILKNSFYDKNLQDIRNGIFKDLSDKGFVEINGFSQIKKDGSIKDNILNDTNTFINNITEDYKYCLNELCILKNTTTYVIKGYYESQIIDYKNSELLGKLKQNLIFNLQDIRTFSGLEMDEIIKFINDNNFIEMENNLFMVEYIKEIDGINSILSRSSIKKNEVNEIIENNGYDRDLFYLLVEVYFSNKRHLWIKK
ncbi:hypothetical protein NAPIS_ORF02025 [Vairimorpha apis BRL 01]|uniref:Uncharacterized protein n=1 Tax=Vairimorpha apis BRL 01 TaxID=1037528 RepID=T0MAL6_9MICR|nr:hypothetical protein NAPIS_ORF02025 [Vairimorpha apis BRL 01]